MVGVAEAVDAAGTVEESLGAEANCHAGIDGLPESGNGDEGVLGKLGPRLRRRAFRDLSSCCSSARD